jgi:transcriptional regulator with XRE-family HTH domain
MTTVSVEPSVQPGQSTREHISFPVYAYIACALTGLSVTQRVSIDKALDVIEIACKTRGVQFYEPRKISDPILNPSLTPELVYRMDRRNVLSSDLFIFLANEPSFGVGQELEIAGSALLPILSVVVGEKTVSRMVRGIPGRMYAVRYENSAYLFEKLVQAIDILFPAMFERKRKMREKENFTIGRNIHRLRVQAGLSTLDLAANLGVPEDEVKLMEGCPDHLTNFSVIQLKQLSRALHTTLPDLLVEDYEEYIAAQVADVLYHSTGMPAQMRDREVSQKDRRHIWARIMRRAAEELERE